MKLPYKEVVDPRPESGTYFTSSLTMGVCAHLVEFGSLLLRDAVRIVASRAQHSV